MLLLHDAITVLQAVSYLVRRACVACVKLLPLGCVGEPLHDAITDLVTVIPGAPCRAVPRPAGNSTCPAPPWPACEGARVCVWMQAASVKTVLYSHPPTHPPIPCHPAAPGRSSTPAASRSSCCRCTSSSSWPPWWTAPAASPQFMARPGTRGSRPRWGEGGGGGCATIPGAAPPEDTT